MLPKNNGINLALTSFYFTEGGKSQVCKIDLTTSAKQPLPMVAESLAMSFVSPRHLLATSPTTFIVCDQGKKAAVHVDTSSGKVLHTFTGILIGSHGPDNYLMWLPLVIISFVPLKN
jgi:hypothetical protein